MELIKYTLGLKIILTGFLSVFIFIIIIFRLRIASASHGHRATCAARRASRTQNLSSVRINVLFRARIFSY